MTLGVFRDFAVGQMKMHWNWSLTIHIKLRQLHMHILGTDGQFMQADMILRDGHLGNDEKEVSTYYEFHSSHFSIAHTTCSRRSRARCSE